MVFCFLNFEFYPQPFFLSLVFETLSSVSEALSSVSEALFALNFPFLSEHFFFVYASSIVEVMVPGIHELIRGHNFRILVETCKNLEN